MYSRPFYSTIASVDQTEANQSLIHIATYPSLWYILYMTLKYKVGKIIPFNFHCYVCDSVCMCLCLYAMSMHIYPGRSP